MGVTYSGKINVAGKVNSAVESAPDALMTMTVGVDLSVEDREVRGYNGWQGMGNLTDPTLGGEHIHYLAASKDTTNLLALLIETADVPDDIFDTLEWNGEVFNSASAAYESRPSGQNITRWLWALPDDSFIKSLVIGEDYGVIFS